MRLRVLWGGSMIVATRWASALRLIAARTESMAHMFSPSVQLCSVSDGVMTKPFGLVYCKGSLTLRSTSNLVFHEAKLSWLQSSQFLCVRLNVGQKYRNHFGHFTGFCGGLRSSSELHMHSSWCPQGRLTEVWGHFAYSLRFNTTVWRKNQVCSV